MVQLVREPVPLLPRAVSGLVPPAGETCEGRSGYARQGVQGLPDKLAVCTSAPAFFAQDYPSRLGLLQPWAILDTLPLFQRHQADHFKGLLG